MSLVLVMDIVIFIWNSKQQKRDVKDMKYEMNREHTNTEKKPGPNNADPTK